MNPRRGGWAALLAVGCLAFSAHYSRLAPCGAWTNHIFGEEAWSEADPGSFYVAAAHELAFRESPLFVGHPGTTLLPLLRAVQSGLYRLRAPPEVSFTRFTAQHLPEVFFWSKLLMTVLHLLSFAALYALARALLRDRRAAALATLGYATCLPVLYYLSRISVEPIQIACLLAAFLAVHRYEDRARAGRGRAALAWVAAAGALSVSSAMSKLAFGAPLPFLLALQIAFCDGRTETGRAIAPGMRWAALAAFAAVALATLAFYSQLVDWALFAKVWRAVARRQVAPDWELADLAPGLGATRIFLACELGYLALAASGLALFLRERPDGRRRALWLAAYGLFGGLFFAYRVWIEGNFRPFHYAFVLEATAAPFFAYGSLRAWRGLRGRSARGPAAAVAALLWLLLLHGVALAAVVDARRYDAEQFEARRPAYPLVARLEGEDQRLGVVQRRWGRRKLEERLVKLHGFGFPFAHHRRESRLALEFESFFEIQRPTRVPADTPRAFVPILGANVVLLDGPSRSP